MKQREEKYISKNKEKKNVSYDVSHCTIHVVDGAVININEREGRILFFNVPMLNASDGSITCQCPVEIRMSKKVLLEIVDDLTSETVKSLMNIKEEIPEIMFA